MADGRASFEQVVFSGGGLRCFWQGGFVEVLTGAMELAPERIAGVSGGALSAACFLAGAERRVLDAMTHAFAREDTNITWHDIDDEDGLTPHQRVYRTVVSATLDADAETRVADGPAFQVLIARPPVERAPALSGTAAALAYEAELHLRSTPHFNWAETIGLTAERIDARAAARDGRLSDLVCAAATIPPVFRPPDWDGQPVIDGGMADQAPMPEPDEGRTLVLLTRTYRNLPDVPGRRYVGPSEGTPADKIDFTDPDALRATWEQGMRDAEDFLRNFEPSLQEE